MTMKYAPQSPDFERSWRTLTICQLDAHVIKGGKRTHCLTGMQTLMCLVGRAGVTG